jgi:hypothetical protein
MANVVAQPKELAQAPEQVSAVGSVTGPIKLKTKKPTIVKSFRLIDFSL